MSKPTHCMSQAKQGECKWFGWQVTEKLIKTFCEYVNSFDLDEENSFFLA